VEEAFKELDPDLETFDERVEYTKEVKASRKARGKGPPKKKRTAAESRKFGKRKPVGST